MENIKTFFKGIRSIFCGYFVAMMVGAAILIAMGFIENLYILLALIALLVVIPVIASTKRLWREDNIFCLVFTANIALFLAGSGFYRPYIAKNAHQMIAIGMSADEVRNILSGGIGRARMYCEVMHHDDSEWLYGEDNCFEFISRLNEQAFTNMNLNVLYTGPVFWRTTFSVVFDRDGNVITVTPLEGSG